MTTLEERIAEEIDDTPVEHVDELILDDCKCSQLTALTDAYVNLERLSAVACGLTTLKGFPSLPNLKRLDLGNNKLTDADIAYLAGCPALSQLVLCANSIKDVSSLEPLKAHKSLRKLDITECDVSETEDFRKKVFEMLDQLIYLNGQDRDEQVDNEPSEVEEDDDEEDGDLSEGEDGDVHDDSEEDVDDDVSDDDDEDDDEEEEQNEKGIKRKHEEEEEEDA